MIEPRMNMVRCPRCRTEHRLEPDVLGYTCAGCGTDWLFVQCAQCHSRFHSATGIETWTCKRCGFSNTVPPEAIAAGLARTGRRTPHRQPTGWSRLSPRGRLAVVVVPVVIAAVVVAVVLANSGGGGGPGGNSKLAAARLSYCNDQKELQNGYRIPALGRFLAGLRQDIALYRAAGDSVSVGDLQRIQSVTRNLRDALRTNRGVSLANNHMNQVLAKGPTC